MTFPKNITIAIEDIFHVCPFANYQIVSKVVVAAPYIFIAVDKSLDYGSFLVNKISSFSNVSDIVSVLETSSIILFMVTEVGGTSLSITSLITFWAIAVEGLCPLSSHIA